MAKIHLESKHNPLAWMLNFTKLQVGIDGQTQTLSWGQQELDVPAGRHQVDISFRYFGSQRGRASAVVDANEDAPVRLRYRMGSWMLSPGKLSID